MVVAGRNAVNTKLLVIEARVVSHETVVVELHFGSGILGINNLIADRDFHRDSLAVIACLSGAYGKNFRLLRFLLLLAGNDDTGCCCSFSFQLLQNNSVL